MAQIILHPLQKNGSSSLFHLFSMCILYVLVGVSVRTCLIAVLERSYFSVICKLIFIMLVLLFHRETNALWIFRFSWSLE